jgi:hypothetical protein
VHKFSFIQLHKSSIYNFFAYYVTSFDCNRREMAEVSVVRAAAAAAAEKNQIISYSRAI